MQGEAVQPGTVRMLVAMCLVVCGQAHPQRLLVETEALSVAREAVGVHVESVDMGRGEALPLVQELPGDAALGPMLLTPDSRGAVVSTGTAWTGGEYGPAASLTFVSSLATAPFQLAPHFGHDGTANRILAAEGWRLRACTFARDSSGEPVLVATETYIDPYGVWRGRLHVRRCLRVGSDSGIVFAGDPVTWPLPGAPVAAVASEDSAREGCIAVVLCRSADGADAILHVLDAESGRVLVDGRRLVSGVADGLGAEPVELALSLDGRYLFALAVGYAATALPGDSQTLLQVFDGTDFGPVGDPTVLKGVADPLVRSLVPAAKDSCWVATHSPGTDFAYLSLVGVTGQACERLAEYPVVGADRALRVSVGPDGRGVAVATENRLEVWPEGSPGSASNSYDASIAALAWTAEGLFVGEGGRVHLADQRTGAPLRTLQLQSGHVSEIVLLPQDALPAPDPDGDGVGSGQEQEMGTDPGSPDSDGDRVPDGSDPEPTVASPRVAVPPLVVFREEAAGRETRQVSVGMLSVADSAMWGPSAAQSSWKVDFDVEKIPWLHVQPRSGALPGYFEASIDAAAYERRSALTTAVLTVSATGTVAGTRAAYSPARVDVRILRERSPARRILWILGDSAGRPPLRDRSDPHALRDLLRLLASPPHFFSHREGGDPFVGALESYDIVVLDAAAASHGAVTRPALFDYVAEGGALLLLGASSEEGGSRSLTHWLGAMGIQLNSALVVNGTFSSAARRGLVRHWDGFVIRDGCSIGITEEDLFDALVPSGLGSNQAVFAARRYGHGRVAALAAATPFESKGLAEEGNRRFAAALFRWLSRAGREVDDLDGDGLPDAVEDRDGNGTIGPGETDPRNPDSDGDGVPDGVEDGNRNGAVEADETSPLNPDSDGDGVADGADATPLPPAEAPRVGRVDPAQCPAEGGVHVVVSGRNFVPGTQVWFGSRRSRKVQCIGATNLIAEVPPCETPEGTVVDVRLRSPAVEEEGTLPSGFNYTPLSRVELAAREARGEDGASGEVSIVLHCDPAVSVGRITLLLEPEPDRQVRWESVMPGTMASFTGRKVIHRPSPSGGIWIDASPGGRGPHYGALAVARWETEGSVAPGEPPSFAITRPHVSAPNGVRLAATVRGADGP